MKDDCFTYCLGFCHTQHESAIGIHMWKTTTFNWIDNWIYRYICIYILNFGSNPVFRNGDQNLYNQILIFLYIDVPFLIIIFLMILFKISLPLSTTPEITCLHIFLLQLPLPNILHIFSCIWSFTRTQCWIFLVFCSLVYPQCLEPGQHMKSEWIFVNE